MQSSEQESEVSAIIKKRAAPDSIPQDVALLVVEAVKGWVEGKTIQERERATKTRNSTLRALVLSCRINFRFYFPALLENVTIDLTHLISIQILLQRENYGHLVRSLHFQPLPARFSETTRSLLWNDFAAISNLPSSVDSSIRSHQAAVVLSTRIFRNVPAIETLLVESTIYIHALFRERHAFLMNFLMKLYINSVPEGKGNLSARNGLWLLLFVPSLQEIALRLDYSIEDLQFFLEFGDTVEGLSRVSKLSLHLFFIWEASRSKTWWGLKEESYRHSTQGSQKTYAVSQLLRCVNTNQLVSLEIVGNFGDQRKGDSTRLLVECLEILQHSFNSPLHLRLLGLVVRKERSYSNCFSNFKSLKMLTLDGNTLSGLHLHGPKFTVPSSLEVIWLPGYNDQEFVAEDYLLQFIKLKSSSLSKLREVAVPATPVLPDGIPVNVEKWTRQRERLEKEEIFTSGKVILRKAEEAEKLATLPSRVRSFYQLNVGFQPSFFVG